MACAWPSALRLAWGDAAYIGPIGFGTCYRLVLGSRKKFGHLVAAPGAFSSLKLSWGPGFRYPSP